MSPALRRTWPRPLSPEERRRRLTAWRWHASALAMNVLSTAAVITTARKDIAAAIGLSLNGWQALSIIGSASCGVDFSDLGRRLGISRQAARPLAALLERRGYIEYSCAFEDRRAVLLDLTPGGRDALARADARWNAWLVDAAHGLEREQMERIGAELAHLRRNAMQNALSASARRRGS